MRNFLLTVLFIFFFLPARLNAQSVILAKTDSSLQIGRLVQICNDTAERYNVNNIISSNEFVNSDKNVPAFLSKKVNNIWVRFSIKNISKDNDLLLSLRYAYISNIDFYKATGSTLQLLSSTGNDKNFSQRTDADLFFNFKLALAKDSEATYYLKINSVHPLELPMFITNYINQDKFSTFQIIVISIYAGILLSIFLYNLFLFFSIRDISYVIYIIYILLLLLAQLTFSGFSFKYFWPNTPEINNFAVIITSSLPGIAALLFAIVFLHIKNYSKNLLILFYVLIVFYIFIPFSPFVTSYYWSYNLLNYGGIMAGVLVLVTSAYIAKKGYRPAYYYFISWFVFAAGRVISALKNLGVLPYNTFTNYILFIGSAFEAILLSLALADRINVLQEERNASQKMSLSISQENERLIKQQNIVLEEKVTERTNELQLTNHHLINTLTELKDAQLQLVEAEKMASLGQLTAGIAHEINNPINFVKSNIVPLKMDVKDIFSVIDKYDELHTNEKEVISSKLMAISSYKKEIDIDLVKNEIENLINGIEEGAERTAEIVRGLRTFSRVDESELKTANVHEGIDSTLVLLRNSMPAYIKVKRNYQAKGDIECFPGKLNQVFMNILNNAVQAINSKATINPEESIFISTRDTQDNQIEIIIKDTGPGMSDEVKQKIYEPFFTTKAVGEGTGLGMAIVFKIIEKHLGKINITSSVGNGAEFTLILPHIHPLS